MQVVDQSIQTQQSHLLTHHRGSLQHHHHHHHIPHRNNGGSSNYHPTSISGKKRSSLSGKSLFGSSLFIYTTSMIT
uniref:Uncharacterized protein n=1 Tax=Lepeophtheirus salmonis TaxID=72036 RepID=A0A0K2UP39_LEPSM